MVNNKNQKQEVFISYVRDNSPDVDKICEEFRRKDIEYWLDRDEIEPGKLWKNAIRDAINKGAYFLACFSKEYEERSETYMNEELFVAIEIMRTKRYDSGWLIPIKLSESEIPAIDIGAGKTLQDLHYLNFHEDWDTEINRLIDIIKRVDDSSKKHISDDFFEKQYIYQGLKSLIESGDGTGFHNADLGHPVYVLGAKGIVDKSLDYADLPEKNLLFKMLSKLSKELRQSGIEDFGFIWWYDFSEWKDFCKFALEVYNKRKDY